MSVPKKQASEIKTFAQKYSTEFEELLLEIINDTLKCNYQIDYSKNTCAKNDGGYDGYCILKTKDAEEITSLLEAKLRSCFKDLPLSDFSKSVIIAINIDADCIVVGTNLYFSDTSVEQLKNFIDKTGLEIRTVDYKDIQTWINENPNKCTYFNQELIDNLIIDVEKNSTAAARSLSLLDNSEFEFAKENEIEIYGSDRKEIRSSIVKELSKAPRSFVITGEKGIGKNALINSIIYRLNHNNDVGKKTVYSIKRVDLSQISSKNDFIYNIISELWGCNYSDTVDFMNQLGNKKYKEFIEGLIPQKTFNALMALADSKKASVDLEVFYSYISSLYNKTFNNKRVQRVFYFYNTEYTNSEILKNVLIFIRKMSRSVSIFLCLQTKMLDGSTTDVFKDFCTSVYECEGITKYEMKEWKSCDSISFVKGYTTDKTITDNANTIIDYFGNNPACIKAGIEMIECDKLNLTLISKNSIGIDKVFSFQKIKSAFFKAKSNMRPVQLKMLYLLIFINEKLHFNFLREVIGLDEDELNEEANAMPFIKYEDNHLHWKDRFFGDLFAENDDRFMTLSEERQLLNNIINNISLLSLKQFRQNFVLLKVYLKLGKHSQAKELSLKYIEELKAQEQDAELYRVTDMLIQHNLFNPDKYRSIMLRIEYMRSALKIGMNVEDTDFDARYKELADIMKQVLTGDDPSEEINALLGEFYYISAIYHLTHSEYKKMYEDCISGLTALEKIKTIAAMNLKGELCANCAVSIKHLFNIEACVSYLESNEAVGKEPAIKETLKYQISYHTHHASLYTGNDPQRALDEFLSIEQLCKEYSQEAYLHNLHNISSMQFSLKRYDEAFKNAKKVQRQSYEYNISVEFGRSQNVLGGLMWKNQSYEEAKQHFKNSYEHFEKHRHNTHMWAPLTNLATLCAEIKDKDAYYYAKMCFDFLVKNHIDKIKNAKISDNNIPKVLVAILMLLHDIEISPNKVGEIDRYIQKLPNVDIKALYDKYIKDKPMCQIFKGTAYNCDGIVILKV